MSNGHPKQNFLIFHIPVSGQADHTGVWYGQAQVQYYAHYFKMLFKVANDL